MKITWKIFFSTILTLTITFCTGGYLLISSFFRGSYNRSLDSAQNQNRIYQLMLASYLDKEADSTGTVDRETMEDALESISGGLRTRGMRIRVLDEQKKACFISGYMPSYDTTLTDIISAAQNASRLIRDGDDYYLEVVSQIMAGDTTYYIDTFHDATQIFADRDEQIRVYQNLMMILFIINGLLSYMMARFLVRPLQTISMVATDIAGGNLSVRIPIRGSDEIADLSARFNEMADALEEKIVELEVEGQRREEFIASFAHELKTPMTSIIGYADVLRSNKQSPELNFMCANYIFQEGKRLESLSFRMLDLIMLDRQEMHVEPVNIEDFFDRIREITLPIVIKEEIVLDTKGDGSVIWIEQALIQTVILNFIDNARKAMEDNRRILLEGYKEGKYYVISVTDHGKGIPKEDLKKITEAFYMVDKSRSRQQGGAGLGLAISAKIAEGHGGYLDFESEPGKGTKAKLYLAANPEGSEKR